MFARDGSTVFYLHANKDYALMYDVVKVENHRPQQEFVFSFKLYNRND